MSDQTEITNVFNDLFFLNVGKDIGKDSVEVNGKHPSIIKINEICPKKDVDDFYFQHIDKLFC